MPARTAPARGCLRLRAAFCIPWKPASPTNAFSMASPPPSVVQRKSLEGTMFARPSVKLSPRDPDAAPITVVFTAFPGLHLRFGRWYREPFPDCGCDACDESAEGEIERLNEMVDAVAAGGGGLVRRSEFP